MVKYKVFLILTIQSFAEAGGLEVFPELEMIGVISCKGYGREHSGEIAAIEEANKNLSEKAQKEGYSNVFGVKYTFNCSGYLGLSSYRYDCLVIGTAYKKKSVK